jgi:hypothetical protein
MNHNNTQSYHRTGQKKRRIFPELVPTPAEREAAYYAALELVAVIDENLRRDIFHYRNNEGKLLTSLDEVVHAIMMDDLLLPQQKQERVWVQPQRLAA